MKSRPIAISLVTLVSAISLALIFVIGYLFFQFEKRQVSDGAYLGLAIGDSKQVTYEKIPQALAELSHSDSRIFVEIEVDSAASDVISMGVGRHAMVQTSLEPVGLERFRAADQWKFYIGASYMNTLTLEFCDGRLCRISRMKKPFEVP